MDGSTSGVLSTRAVVGYISSREETGVRADGETSSVQSDADVASGSHVAIAMAACDTEFRNTGLERSEALAKDLTLLKEQGHSIPEPSQPRLNYSACLEELSKNDPQTFICHFYNTYFAHSAGARMIGRKVAEKVFNGNELEFYKWDGDLSQLLQSFRDKLNVFAENWTREEKNHCLEETEESFKYSEEILRLILS